MTAAPGRAPVGVAGPAPGTAPAQLKAVAGHPFKNGGHWVVVVYHPSYFLRVPGEDAKAQAFGVMVEGLRTARELAAQP